MTKLKITPRANGPYLVYGSVRIVHAKGTEYDVSDQQPIALCRCGASNTKPLCDSTHERTGFQAADRGVHAAA